jgi:hypothetical protein
MKKVFSNTDEVIHVFAQQTQSEGRNQSRSLFFEGKKIYSYGYHYLLGEFINNGKAIIINDNGYSVTTSKHISKLRTATNHYKQFNITNIDIDNVYNEISKDLISLSKARKPEIYLDSIFSLFDQLNEWIEYTKENKIKHKYVVKKSTSKYIELKNIVKELKENYNTFLSNLKETQKIAKETKRKKEVEQLKTALEKFNSYKTNFFRIGNFDYLRLSKDSTKVETSQGVRIDVNEAKKLYLAIKNNIDIVGYKLGYYRINHINSKSLKAGCHNICIKNIEQIGYKLLTL